MGRMYFARMKNKMFTRNDGKKGMREVKENGGKIKVRERVGDGGINSEQEYMNL